MNDTARDMQVLVVDETEGNLLFWEVAVKEAFDAVKIQTCSTGYEALEVAKKGRFDLFVAAWEMQPMSGLIFMQKLREIYKYKHTPFLIYSQLLQEEDLILAEEFGIRNYLLKPFDKARVIEKMRQMVDEEKNLDPTARLLRKIEDWINENKINEALKLINDVLNKPGPYSAKAWTLNGDIWARADHFEKAERSYKEALKFDAEYMQAISGLGKLYLKNRRFAEAAAYLEQLHKKAPKNLSRMVQLGSAYLGTGNDVKAEQLFREVKSLDNENSEATAGLGKVAFARGNLELAAKFFKESGKGEELASYFNNMGISLVNQGRHDDAIAFYRNAISVMPDRSKCHLLDFNIALAYKKSERYGEAANSFAMAYLSKPDYIKAYQGMALCLKEAQARKQEYNKKIIQDAVAKYKEMQEANSNPENSGTSA